MPYPGNIEMAESVEQIIRDPNVDFTTTPERVQQFADFEARVGLIKQAPASWRIQTLNLRIKNV